jgi:hypothetical protein
MRESETIAKRGTYEEMRAHGDHDTKLYCVMWDIERPRLVEIGLATAVYFDKYECSIPESIRKYPGFFRREVVVKLSLVPWYERIGDLYASGSRGSTTREVDFSRMDDMDYMHGTATTVEGGAVVSVIKTRQLNDGVFSPAVYAKRVAALATNELRPLDYKHPDGHTTNSGPSLAYPRFITAKKRVHISVSRIFVGEGESNIVARSYQEGQQPRREAGNFDNVKSLNDDGFIGAGVDLRERIRVRDTENNNVNMGASGGIYCEFWTHRNAPEECATDHNRDSFKYSQKLGRACELARAKDANTTWYYEIRDVVMISTTTAMCDSIEWPEAQDIFVKVSSDFGIATVSVLPALDVTHPSDEDRRISKTVVADNGGFADKSDVKDIVQGRYEYGAGLNYFLKETPTKRPYITYVHPHAQFAYSDDHESQRQRIYVFGGHFPKEELRIKRGMHHNKEVHLRPNESALAVDEAVYTRGYKCVFHSPLLHKEQPGFETPVKVNLDNYASRFREEQVNVPVNIEISKNKKHTINPDGSNRTYMSYSERRVEYPAEWLSSGLLTCGYAPLGSALGVYYGLPVKGHFQGAVSETADMNVGSGLENKGSQVYEDFSVQVSIFYGDEKLGETSILYVNQLQENLFIPRKVVFDHRNGGDAEVVVRTMGDRDFDGLFFARGAGSGHDPQSSFAASEVWHHSYCVFEPGFTGSGDTRSDTTRQGKSVAA